MLAPAPANELAGHWMQAVDAGREYIPAAQAAHVVAPWFAVAYVPPGHMRQLEEPLLLPNSPDSQEGHDSTSTFIKVL